MTIVLLLALLAGPQDNTSDASVSRASKLAAGGRVPSPDEIRVYDFINFHRHDLPEPGRDGAVALDVRLLRAALPDGAADAAIQIGLRTARPDRRTRPINLTLVLDKSGSMSGDNKMGFLRDALELLVANLTEDDVLAIVVFDGDARVLRAAAPAGDAKALRALIRSIQPGGGTNLHGGLMLGYEQALKHLDPKRANKVVLLSDGQATAGEKDPEKIVADSNEFHARGIDLSTVGVGIDYNDSLMNQLAQAGRGTYHFLDSGDGIRRVFEKELISLLEKVGRSPVVRIELARGVTFKALHGYAIEHADERTIVVKLLDLPLALTQVIPLEVAVAAEADRGAPLAKVRLDYVDEKSGKPARVEREARAGRLDGAKEAAADAGVMKNFAIARLAAALREACSKAQRNERPAAKALLGDAVRETEALFGADTKDEDILKVLAIARGLLGALG